jgi:acyl-CoA thioesterase-1
VHRPKANCGPTTRGLEHLDAWLGDGKWDLIHFNWGLHDLKFINEKGQRDLSGKQQVPPAEYEKNLRTLVQRLKATGATLIFATTTPVPKGASGRIPGDSAKYNEIARKVMQDGGVAIDDLYGFALPRLKEIQRPADVHFTPEGSKALAGQVAKSIVEALKKE